jgi:hypothetical protein
MPTRRQINLFRDLSDIRMKIWLTVLFGGCYLGILIVLVVVIFTNEGWQNAAILGFIESILTLSIPQIVKHFFPSRDNQQ